MATRGETDNDCCVIKRVTLQDEDREKKKKQIKIYVWLPHGENVGHSSMKLSDGIYISWWPSDKDLKKMSNIASMLCSPAELSRNLEEDIRLEDNIEPNRIYTLSNNGIDGINEAAISKWWESFRSNGSYRVFDQNCCHVVFRALEAGGAWKLFANTNDDVESLGKKLLRPEDIDKLVRKVAKKLH